ncbi:MAG TPA: DUF1987 domain-containing protein [Bacteroidales bacterium]|nr:DUF1987 domain-containing protein [Bacteroidales bacterium]HPF02084.1 DUF1987 domain-containing protein [Bacteroidales bacterium]HPJ59129.1 DUF1987 domain-containing protein [Bacteroidales bacterium]HPR11429.1 DUF1987 domain-containing protein [Bacteroidales bacterium]HRW85256.1 DUF1987 domain-containing protein [Bacteroidales bacterium]
MQRLFIEQTELTPEINFSPSEKIFMIRGVSSPEDVRALYYPVIEWIRIYADDILESDKKVFTPDSPLTLQIDLSYFNSSSAKFLYDILMEIRRLHIGGVPVVIEWIYENEDTDMYEAGTDIAELAEMDFIYTAR